MQFQLTNKSALVVGATGGIGSAVAGELHRRGAALTLVARSAEALDNLAVAGRRLALDMRDPANAQAAVDAVVEHHKRIDILVNAAGVVAFGAVAELDVDTLEELLLTNTMMPMVLSRAALPSMSEGGVILNISGAIAERNLPGMAAYGASKAALASFDQALSSEARRNRVRVIDARPPHTETGLTERAIAGSAPKLKQGMLPADVATVICDAIAGEARDLPSEAFAAA